MGLLTAYMYAFTANKRPHGNQQRKAHVLLNILKYPERTVKSSFNLCSILDVLALSI